MPATPKHVRFNFAVQVMESGLFGLSMGIASYVTVIPLFVASLTDSSILIGLISAMRLIGWQLPQLFTSNRVARLRRYKPMVILMTLNERVPFLGLALVALLLPKMSTSLALTLTFAFVMWQSFGGGITATAWQSMVAKIMPAYLRGRFYGLLTSASNLMSSGGALLSGVILKAVAAPESYAVCFFLAAMTMAVSFCFLTRVRESDAPPALETARAPREFWRGLADILRRDANFRLFVVARILAQVAAVGLAFYTIYAVRQFHMDVGTASVMASVLLIAQLAANPVFGWLGDRHSHRVMFTLGVLLAGASALAALAATSMGWFYAVFALAGFANAGLSISIYALTVEFGTDAERPYYIGLANTLVAPATLLAPIIGGALADSVGYATTFALAAASSLLTTGVTLLVMREPRQHRSAPEAVVAGDPYGEVS